MVSTIEQKLDGCLLLMREKRVLGGWRSRTRMRRPWSWRSQPGAAGPFDALRSLVCGFLVAGAFPFLWINQINPQVQVSCESHPQQIGNQQLPGKPANPSESQQRDEDQRPQHHQP